MRAVKSEEHRAHVERWVWQVEIALCGRRLACSAPQWVVTVAGVFRMNFIAGAGPAFQRLRPDVHTIYRNYS